MGGGGKRGVLWDCASSEYADLKIFPASFQSVVKVLETICTNVERMYVIYIKVLFNKRAGVLYQVIKPQGEAEWLCNAIKHDPRVY